MSERGRSKLFGRPGELLVEETAPRIRMPDPPPPGFDAPADDRFPELFASDEEPSLPTGPLRVYVGPPGGTKEPAGPALRLGALPGTPPPRRPSERVELPADLLDDAVGELGDILGRRIPAARTPSRGTDSDPFRTELPVMEARTPRPRAPADDDHLRTELPTFDILGTPPPREAPTALPGAERGRSVGIATAAARVRTSRSSGPPSGPTLGSYDEEATRIDPSPFQIFERPRTEDVSPRLSDPDAPSFDDPRFRKPDPNEISFISEARVPPRSPALDRREVTEEPTNPGILPPRLDVASRLEAPVRADVRVVTAPRIDDVPVFGALPSAEPKAEAKPEAKAEAKGKSVAGPGSARRRLLLLGGLAAAVMLGALALQWSGRIPGGLAKARPARPVAAAVGAAPAPVEAVAPVEVVPPAPVATAAPAEVPAAPTPESPAPEAPADAATTGAPVPFVPPASASTEVPPPAVPAPAPPAATKAPETPKVATTTGAAATPAAVPSPTSERQGGFQAPTGFLTVVCSHKATIYVNDVKKGTTAGEPLELPAGTHRVRMVGNGSSRTQTIRVDANRMNMAQCGLR